MTNNDTAPLAAALKKYGYADGYYQVTCSYCEGLFVGAKRARCCKPCAEVMLERDNTRPTAPQNAAFEVDRQSVDQATAPQNAEALEALQVLYCEAARMGEYHGSGLIKDCFKTIHAALNQPRTVIKPLVWVCYEGGAYAKTPFGKYEVVVFKTRVAFYNKQKWVADFKTLKEAKSAAEAHWQAKIKECLTDSAQLAAQEGGEG